MTDAERIAELEAELKEYQDMVDDWGKQIRELRSYLDSEDPASLMDFYKFNTHDNHIGALAYKVQKLWESEEKGYRYYTAAKAILNRLFEIDGIATHNAETEALAARWRKIADWKLDDITETKTEE